MHQVRLAYQSVGVIYGDIGTSPLYVYSSTFREDPSHADLLGALSLIIWTLTLMVSIKYVLIVLRADDEGEGGTFAIYSLLSRYVMSHTNSSCIQMLLMLGSRPILSDAIPERKWSLECKESNLQSWILQVKVRAPSLKIALLSRRY